MLLKFSSENIKLIKSLSTMISDGRDTYYHIPFFFKETVDGLFQLETIDSLPNVVVDINKEVSSSCKKRRIRDYHNEKFDIKQPLQCDYYKSEYEGDQPSDVIGLTWKQKFHRDHEIWSSL